ncbi:unnamed protein product [Aphis gossypii]|uniref:Peptidase S1 domain-containing protein n=1 Tax=Aphis gossypii TaxID=80765 RepID=A0A9P0IVV9_APHGO|nr:unnamed protein product [Aphis gossypii]
MKSTYTFILVIYSHFVLGTVALCNKEFNKRQVESTCSDETEYTCKSGQCIDITSICDGLQDCTDGSDETEILCGSTTCPKYAFKCKYGACINIESKCDGVNQCLDGSDEEQCTDLVIESVENSENTSIEESTDTESTIEESTTMEQTTESTTTKQTSISTTTQQTTISTTTASTTIALPSIASTTTNTSSSTVIALNRPKESIEDSSNQNKTCVIPTIEGTKYFYKDLIQNVPVSNGDVVDQYRIVEMDCVEGYYKTVPHKFMVCSESGQWMPKPSETLCSKKCPPMVSDKLDIKCSLNGNNVNCSMPSEPGTILTQSCKVINSNNLSRGQEVMSTPNELLCLQNAQWNGQLLANCTSQEELITNRVKESSVTAPWNVEIYKINNDGHYYRICGGTLIAPNLVVSAAHCFWKKGLRRKILLNENFSTKIAVGKETTNFSVIDNKYTQFIDIKSIYLKESYDGPFGMYADDISVIVLATNIAISNGVWPASIDWSTTNLLSNGDLGKMFGLGINSNMTGMGQDKSILKLFILPYIDRETCQKMYTNGFQYYVTRDKFCTDYKSVAGEKHLTGFGGSGLIYESYNHVPFLTGVLSIKDLHSNKPVAVFTSIAHHVQWICHIYLNHVSIV